MVERLRANPVLVTALIAAIVQLLVGLGLLAEDQGEAIATLLVSLVTVVLGLLARERVSPLSQEDTTYVVRNRPFVHRRDRG